MKLLFDFFPIAAFFIAYKWAGIYIATIIAMLSSLGQVLWGRYQKGRFEMMPVMTLAIISILGGATLFFKNEAFIKWKPTVVYWALALVFLGSQYFGQKKPLMQRLAQDNIALPLAVWRRLNISWVIFFLSMGTVNLYIASAFNTDTWVNFKLFGTLLCTLLFIIGQGIYMFKHRAPEVTQDYTQSE